MKVDLKIVQHDNGIYKFYVEKELVSEKSGIEVENLRKILIKSLLAEGKFPQLLEVKHREGIRKRIKRPCYSTSRYKIIDKFKN